MGKIGDLWVKLGLKKSEFDKGMNDAKKQTSSFTDSIKGIGVKAAAIWAAVGAGLVALADKFAHHSQRFGDLWDNTMSRMKTAWNTFLTALTNWDWNGFGKRIGDAMSAAGRSQAAHDADFEVQNSINIRKSQMQDELAQLQILMRSTKLTYEQRAEYAKQYLNKIKPLYDAEIAQRERVRVADLNEYLSKAGLQQNTRNRDAVEKFFTDVAPNETLLNALDQYSKRNQGKKYKMTAEDQRIVDDFLAQFGNDYSTSAALTVLAEFYQGSSDDEAKKAVDAIVAANAARAAFNEETRRVQQIQNSGAGIDTSAIDTSKLKLKPEQQKQLDPTEQLKKNLEEAGGNVDLLKRKLVDGADLVAAGWKNAGDAVQTLFSQIVETKDASGQEVKVLVSPILSDGSILSPEMLADYVNLNLRGAENMIDADALGIVLKAGVDVDESSQRKLEQLVSQFYEGDIALKEWTDRIREAAEIDAMFEQSIQEMQESLDADIQAQFEEQLNAMLDEMERAAERARQLSEDFHDAIISGFSAGCQELADQLFGLKEVNAGAIFAALLTPLADMAVKEGEILIAEGLGVEACKAALESLNGYAAIAAGAALVAIGVTAKAGLQALAGNGGSSSYATTYSGASSAGNQTQLIETEMTIYVKGEIDGSNILLSGQRTSKDLDR